MSKDATTWELFSQLLSYPGPNYLSQVEELAGELEEGSEAGTRVRSFAQALSGWKLTRVEELFSYSFDMNPATCLEVGWHLYGEDYKRGQLLVKLRQTLAECGVRETLELPDHLSHCLQLLPRLDREESQSLVGRYLGPALDKIVSAFPQENPYHFLVEALLLLLRDRIGGEVETKPSRGQFTEGFLPVLNQPGDAAFPQASAAYKNPGGNHE